MNQILKHLPIPFKGEGTRDFYCPAYSKCGGIAGRGSWPSWNCEPCDKHPLVDEEAEKEPIVEDRKPKICKECDTSKPLIEMRPDKRCPDGYRDICNECWGKRTVEHTQEEPEEEKGYTPIRSDTPGKALRKVAGLPDKPEETLESSGKMILNVQLEVDIEMVAQAVLKNILAKVAV